MSNQIILEYGHGNGVAWVRGMALGEGKPFDPNMASRVERSTRYRGEGTVQNPMVSSSDFIAMIPYMYRVKPY